MGQPEPPAHLISFQCQVLCRVTLSTCSGQLIRGRLIDQGCIVAGREVGVLEATGDHVLGSCSHHQAGFGGCTWIYKV